MTTEQIEAGGVRLGTMFPLAGGAALTHAFAFLHHRTSGRYFLAWAESTREGPSRILTSSSRSLQGEWSSPTSLTSVDGPIENVQLASSGGAETPLLFLTYQPMVPPGSRRPLNLLTSTDGARTWDGPHLVRQDEPAPRGGQVPPLEPGGGPGSEHLLATFVPSPHGTTARPQAWALVATDRFIEWSLALRPWSAQGGDSDAPGAMWGESLYLGLRHHMPLPAYLGEDEDGTLCIVSLRTPTDFPAGVEKPEFPQVNAIRLDLAGITRDHDGDGQPDLEDYLQTHYHADDLYRLWLQCRVDGRDMQKRPFVSGVQKTLKLSKGLVVQSARPYVRPGQGVPRTLLLMGRGVSKQVSIQDIANNRGSRYHQERGKDRYPETQGFHLAPGDVSPDDIKPGMVLVSPGWGQPSHRFSANLQVPSTTDKLPEKALFGFWSHNFTGAILQTMAPDADAEGDVSCRVVVELDEEVVLEDGLSFPILVPEERPMPDRSIHVVGYDEAPGPSYRLVALGKITGMPSTPAAARHIRHGAVL